MMERREIDNLLDRYIKQETSLEENQVIEKWLEAKESSDSLWQNMDLVSKERWLSRKLSAINTSIKAAEVRVIPIRSSKSHWYKVAAVAAVLLLCLTFFWHKSPLSNSYGDATLIAGAIAEKKKIILSDGTIVWLKAGSELKFPKIFERDSRIVYLSGEAYFDVQHDSKRPFLIYTGKVLTTVLGTAFNIKEDKQKHTLEVTVSRGKVSVADGGKLLSVLTPNEQVSLDILSKKVTRKTVNALALVSWKDNEMHFDDITLAMAVEQLEQHFNVKISFNNEKLKNCRFSGVALKADKLESILDVITGFNQASWKRQVDGQIIIYGNGCN